ncbi:hypothetical protein [Photobacterium galatheae]|uniref:Uncharacterized protein n=1 Tax=Photobacterium galatheae TaxID=1654360 RepID=A0A066RHN8_9GAMM|nr:hypothetical protein [Photobacterium galatheae]KDM89970.1 hypothetical protein EA58_19695 [Photobacterium galatheae]MCM0149235.1 hypothetical protein [Photobacterium galatheae]
MDEFLGCRRRERLQPARPAPEKKKHFWALFVLAKSVWRASENTEIGTKLMRDIPLNEAYIAS